MLFAPKEKGGSLIELAVLILLIVWVVWEIAYFIKHGKFRAGT